MRPPHRLLAASVAALLVAAQPAAAQVTLPFSSAATATAEGMVNGQWVSRFRYVDDFTQQVFSDPGLPASVGTLALDLRFLDHANNAVPYGLDVFLNGTNVGSVSFTTGGGTPTITDPSYRLTSSTSFSFAGIAAVGGSYTVRLVQTSASIPDGEGLILMDLDGRDGSTVTFTAASTVPEPATVGLLAAGLVGLAGLARRRARATA